MTRVIVHLFTVLVVAVIGATCSNINANIEDLPTVIAQELQQIIENPISHTMKAQCNHRLVRPNTELLLYTRNNHDEPVVLNITNPKQVDYSKKLVLLVHGWLSGPTTEGIVKMKNAYLKRYDCNVIVVNWSKAAWQPYTAAFCHVQGIAQFMAKAMCYLNKQVNLPLDKVHMVGHSMGAHISGWAGKYIASKCKARVGRITGLNPAGPIFDSLPESGRLEKSDASFVDVIHTDGERFGSAQLKTGHADFYVNCGHQQPGCPDIRHIDNTTLVKDAFCSHHRSMEYMAESINSNNGIAVTCGMCPRYCRMTIISEGYIVMGENCRQETRPHKSFYLRTKGSSPYFQGWDAYEGVVSKFV